ncbi:MAG TPA: helix-turn-helix domain-containing protein [Nitrospiraceae bacterium]|nr:helix-turn-helix domain-containing protein [Nitrospiraceae bacterium]
MIQFGELLRVEDAASALGLRPSTVRKMVLKREIDIVRPSKRAVRIPRAAIEKILKTGYRPAVPEAALSHNGGAR